MRKHRALDLAAELARSADPQIRRNAATALAIVATGESIKELLRLALTDRDGEVRERAEEELLVVARSAPSCQQVTDLLRARILDTTTAEPAYALMGRLRSKGLAIPLPRIGLRQRFGLSAAMRKAGGDRWEYHRPLLMGTVLASAGLMLFSLLVAPDLDPGTVLVLLLFGSCLAPQVVLLMTGQFWRWRPVALELDRLGAFVVDLGLAMVGGLTMGILLLPAAALPSSVPRMSFLVLPIAGSFALLLAVRVGCLLAYGTFRKRRWGLVFSTAAGAAVGITAITLLHELVKAWKYPVAATGWLLLLPISVGLAAAVARVDHQVPPGKIVDAGQAQMLRRFDPPAPVQVHRVRVPASAHEVLVLEASDSPENRPFAFDGRPYERIGTTTSVMPQENYQRLILERAHALQRWENLPSVLTLSDLDRNEILKTVRLGVAAGRLSPSISEDAGDVLDRLGLRMQGRLVNASVVVFGRQLLPLYPECQLRMARFRGTDKTEFLDQRQVCGHALQLLEEALQFLSRHLPVAGRIEPGLFERVDSPLFPPVALREALVNAFCHRDYSIVGGAVSLAIFDDRLEIWSDGTLPFGLKVEDLKRDHLSRPRNPLIAEVFYRRGLIERWGRGTQKIVELCVQAGHPEPEFVEQAGAVGVRFLPSGYIAPHRIAHDLTTRQRRVLQVLAARMDAGFSGLRSSIAPTVAVRTFRDDLLHLKRLGLIGLRGRGRGATWFLIGPAEGKGQNEAE